MLDYAANGTAYWQVDALRAWFEAECEQRGADAAAALAETFALEDDADAYWEAVKTNLAAGRLRLLFVSDEISPELRRIIEFLSSQMTETEVLAIEVKQYVEAGGERQTIVPRVLGQTEAARKVQSRARDWTRDSVLRELVAQHGDQVGEVGRRLGSGSVWPNPLQVLRGACSADPASKLRPGVRPPFGAPLVLRVNSGATAGATSRRW